MHIMKLEKEFLVEFDSDASEDEENYNASYIDAKLSEAQKIQNKVAREQQQ